jgi:hypothetical protein
LQARKDAVKDARSTNPKQKSNMVTRRANLALDLYAHFKVNPPGKSSSEVVKLSGLLNEIGAQIGNRASDFRNVNGVYMKVMNFRRFDPAYISQGKKGLQRGGAGSVGPVHPFASTVADSGANIVPFFFSEFAQSR